MKFKFLLLSALLLAVVNGWAQPVAETDALDRASAFIKQAYLERGKSGNLSLELVSKGNGISPQYYIYNVKGGPGYVVVSGDDRMPEEIPAYSLTGHINANVLSAPFQEILANYTRAVDKVRLSKVSPDKTKKETASLKSGSSAVEPLLGALSWGQHSPYNDMCPIMNGQRAVTGCGATAASQVMKYYAWPPKGKGMAGGINLADQTYNWDLMTPFYSSSSSVESKAAVAKIMYHTGLSFEMRYDTDGSLTDVRYMTVKLPINFDYSPHIRLAYRLSYTDQEWVAMLKREINLGRPIIYGGIGNMGGHAFICDGYDSKDRLHMNYGWDGAENGYVELSALMFPRDNQAIIGLYPSNQTIADVDQAAPQVVMTTPMVLSSYSPALGAPFEMAMKLANYNTLPYNANIGIGLYTTAGVLVNNTLLKIQKVSLPASLPEKGSKDWTVTPITLSGVSIPVGTPDGNYKLRLQSQQGTVWFDAYADAQDVTPALDVKITNGVASFSYPYSDTGSQLKLDKPIEINVANNRASVRFSVLNVDEFYDCEDTYIYLHVSPNNSLFPTVTRRLVIPKLMSGALQSFDITDVPIPTGAGISSCKFFVSYNRKNNKPGGPQETLEKASAPMEPFSYNLRPHTIAIENVIKKVDLNKKTGSKIPSTYAMYDASGSAAASWGPGILSNASSKSPNAKLVTDPIIVKDDNMVLEWQMSNMYSSSSQYKLYVSTNGQAFENFVTPVYSQVHPDKYVARYHLGRHAGQTVCVAFESHDVGAGYDLMYYSLLDVKTPKDIALDKITLKGTVLDGEVLPLSFTVKNNSAVNVTKVKASYTIGVTEFKEEFTSDIPFNKTEDFTFSQPITASGKLGETTLVKVHIEMEGEDSKLLENNNAETLYQLAYFYPRKGTVFYKTSKIGCYGCSLSYLAVEEYEEMYPELAVGAELWRNGDLSTNDFPNFVEGTTPSFFLNGRRLSTFEEGLNKTPNEIQQMNPPANVMAIPSFATPESREMKIELKANFALPVIGTYKIGAIVIENNLIDIHNQGPGGNVSGEKLTKNHIPVTVINDQQGDLTIINPQAKEYSFVRTVTIPKELAYRYRKDNMQVITVLYNQKGEIINASLDSYYIKIPQTAGLTFHPVEGYGAFKTIYDLKKINSSTLFSVTNCRAKIAFGDTYKFTIAKDSTWAGKKPKLILNKGARYNRDIIEELIPDAQGVYTITNADRFYHVEIEAVDAPEPEIAPFTVKYNGEALAEGDWVDINTYKTVGTDKIMKFEVDVTKNSDKYPFTGMRIEKIPGTMMPYTAVTLCWDLCMTPDDLYATCDNIVTGVAQHPYAEMYLNYGGDAVVGISEVSYKFSTTSKAITPLTVNVRYNYQGELTYVDTEITGLKIYTTPGGNIEIIDTESRTLHLYTLDGRIVKPILTQPGRTTVEGLSRGVYLLNRQKVVL